MSSPVNDDLDKRVMYAPPWAREAPQQPPQAIVAAIERLRLERLKATQSPQDAQDAQDAEQREQDNLDQHELPLERGGPVDIEAAMADTLRASWRPASLEPVTMPEPPKPQLDGPTWGMIARLSGAVACAAAVALFVSGAVPLPSIGISLSSSEGAKASPSVTEAFGGSKQALPVAVADAQPPAVSPASAPAPAALPASVPIAAPVSAPPTSGPAPSDFRSAFASLDTAAVVPAPKPLGPKIEGPAAQPAAQPALTDVRPLDRDELAGLVKRGQTLLAEGDISSARLLLRRAAEAGDAAAALTLAGTYDRAELAKLKVIGVAHDHAQAKAWYKKAAEHGSAEAVRRLQQLAQRAD
jgi:hypothetical protein